MENLPVWSKERTSTFWRICLKYLGHQIFPWRKEVQMAARETEMKTHPLPEEPLSSDGKEIGWQHLRDPVDL